jgi:hypothetical protein
MLRDLACNQGRHLAHPIPGKEPIVKIERVRAVILGGTAALLIAGASSAGVFAATSDASPYIFSGGTYAAQEPEAVPAEATAAAGAPEAAEAAEVAGLPEADEGVDADGPGGHADPVGQEVDHQFEGEE